MEGDPELGLLGPSPVLSEGWASGETGWTDPRAVQGPWRPCCAEVWFLGEPPMNSLEHTVVHNSGLN